MNKFYFQPDYFILLEMDITYSLPVYGYCWGQLRDSQVHEPQHLHPHEAVQEADAQIQYNCVLGMQVFSAQKKSSIKLVKN